jgi:hypothetical protein
MADDIVKEGREAMEISYQYDRDNRREAMEDLRFVAGFQWSDAARAERSGRPMITINRSAQFLRQVSNPIRQNMPTLKTEPDGDRDLDMAEIVNGLLRRIQYNSSAAHVYAQAVEHMVACGIGWFRITTDYTDPESFDQDILIRRIFNPLSVYPDPSSLEPDRSDMNWALVSELIPLSAFKVKYPKASCTGLDMPSNGGTGTASNVTWGNGDYVRVAEFWKRTARRMTLARLVTGETVSLTDMGEAQAGQLMQSGYVVATRPSVTYDVEMHLISGNEVLEQTYRCPCKWIPLIPVIGAEIPLEEGVYRHGLIRFQREPQALHNYFMSVAAESLGQQPKVPYLVTPKQIQHHKAHWDNANKKPLPYLPYDPDERVPGGKPDRVAPPPLPTALINMAQMLAEDMKATTGIYDAALGARSNETSGVAIGQRIEQGNQATYHFSDNLEHGIEHAGRIMLDMMPKVYDTNRVLRLIGADDTEREVEINKPVPSLYGEETQNDLTNIKFKAVRVVLGPNYATRRQEAVAGLMELIKAVPDVAAVAGDIIVKNLNFEGAEELAERLKALLPPAVLQMQNPEALPGPDPAQEAERAAVEQQMALELEATGARTAQEQAKAEREAAKARGVHIDNALKVKKLREPRPLAGTAGRDGPYQ